MPGSWTTPGRAGTRANASVRVAFRAFEHVGTRVDQAFAAQWLAYALSYRRFADTLASANARLGADADRYSSTVGDFHLLLFAGFDRRTESLDIIKTVWTQPNCSYRGRYHSFENFTLVPRPAQQPHPQIRIAASQHETYATIGELGYSLFSAVRASPLTELAYHKGLSRGLGRRRSSRRAARVPASANLRRRDPRSRAQRCARRYDAVLDLSCRFNSRATEL